MLLLELCIWKYFLYWNDIWVMEHYNNFFDYLLFLKDNDITISSYWSKTFPTRCWIRCNEPFQIPYPLARSEKIFNGLVYHYYSLKMFFELRNHTVITYLKAPLWDSWSFLKPILHSNMTENCTPKRADDTLVLQGRFSTVLQIRVW